MLLYDRFRYSRALLSICGGMLFNSFSVIKRLRQSVWLTAKFSVNSRLLDPVIFHFSLVQFSIEICATIPVLFLIFSQRFFFRKIIKQLHDFEKRETMFLLICFFLPSFLHKYSILILTEHSFIYQTIRFDHTYRVRRVRTTQSQTLLFIKAD